MQEIVIEVVGLDTWRDETKKTSEERLWTWYHMGEEEEEEEEQSRDGEPSGQQKMKFMTQLAEGELCLPQLAHN